MANKKLKSTVGPTFKAIFAVSKATTARWGTALL
jgi:hypothetical protein